MNVHTGDRFDRPQAAAHVWVGLDTAGQTTALCCLDDDGEVLTRSVVPTKAAAVQAALIDQLGNVPISIGLEACSTSIALAKGLRKLGYSVALFDCSQIKRFASIRRSKTDANDARSIADVTRLGRAVLTEVHLKSSECFTMRSKLAARHNIIQQRKATEQLIRSFLSLHGSRIGVKISAPHLLRHHISARLEELLFETGEDHYDHLIPLVDMAERQREEIARLQDEITAYASGNAVCRDFMAVPGVGALTAVSFYTAIEDPSRFSRSGDVGAYFGLTPKIHRSGLAERNGRITKAGNVMTRFHLIAAANAIFNATKTDNALRRWGLNLASKVGRPKARVAVARKLATILFSMWRDQRPFCPGIERQSEIYEIPCAVSSGERCTETSFNHVGRACEPDHTVMRLGAAQLQFASLTDKQKARMEREAEQMALTARYLAEGVSVVEIARRLGVSTGTVYRRRPTTYGHGTIATAGW